MSKADKLFSRLGYIKNPSTRTKERYEKIENDCIYYIIFNEKMKVFSKTCDYGKTHFKAEELKAIVKKCEELEWYV